MAKYYFFKLSVVTVSGSDGRPMNMRKLLPLPGQTLPNGHGVNTAIPGRMSVRDRSRAMGYPLGTIFGVKFDGVTYRRTTLVEHHDHCTVNYDLTQKTIVMCGYFNEADQALRTMPYNESDPHRPDGEMAARLNELLGIRAAQTDARPAQTAEQSGDAAECDFREGSEMDNIERGLAGTGTMREILTRCLDLSRLRDRMRKGVVKFRYRKASDSSERTAYGTRCPEVIALYRAATTRESGREQTVGDGIHFYYMDCGRGNEAPDENPLRNFITTKYISFDEDSFIPASDVEAIRALRYENN